MVDSKQEIAFVALGTNMGTVPQMFARLRRALELLRDVPDITLVKKSAVYRTAAWGVTDQPDFLNAMVQLRTGLSPAGLLRELKCIEQQLGRLRRVRWGPREIDLDIVLFGTRVVNEADLTIPHPGMLERNFVLVPLLEIAPEVQLPDGRLVRESLREDAIEKLPEPL